MGAKRLTVHGGACKKSRERNLFGMRLVNRFVAWGLCLYICSVISMCIPSFALEDNAKLPVAATTPKSSVSESPSAKELFSRIATRHRWQEAHLNRLSEIRTYKMENDKHRVLAREVVAMQYTAPETKTFSIVSASGSGFIRHHVFQRLREDEEKRLRSKKDDPDGLITPENYTMVVVGTEPIGGFDCLVVHVLPRRKETHLFEGDIWVERQDFAILKITGRLAKSPSFWIKYVDFVRAYQKVGSFWLASSIEASSHVRVFGKRVLTIDYGVHKASESDANSASSLGKAIQDSPGQ